MKTQLKVGKGEGDLPSIPGVTAYANPDDYTATLPDLLAAAAKVVIEPVVAASTIIDPTVAAKTANQPVVDEPFFSGVTIIGLAIGLLAAPFLAKKFKGMSVSEVIATIFELIGTTLGWLFRLLSNLVGLVTANKNKVLPEK